jgi:curli biogenesis system outer membrane secretion channel CsgG
MARRLAAGSTCRVAAALSVAFLNAGCAQYVWIEEEVSPGYDYKSIKTVAVPEFANRTANADAGRLAAERAEELLVAEGPFKVITRLELDRLLNELKLSAEGLIDAETMNKLGRVGGVDALLLGTIEVWEFEEKKDWSKTRTTVEATLAVAFKLVNSTSGEVVWSKSSKASASECRSVLATSKLPGERECFEEALAGVLSDLKSMFPRTRRTRARVEDTP